MRKGRRRGSGMAPFERALVSSYRPPKKADFAMKQTNICRLSGDIMNVQVVGSENYTYNVIECIN